MVSTIIKEKTKAQHEAVEAKLYASKIFEGRYTLADYETLIQLHYDFIVHFEKAVFSAFGPATAEGLNLERRRKLPLIVQDLQQLKICVSENSSATVLSAAEAFGVLYVMEGATLGGTVIARQLSKYKNFKDLSFNYLNCYGAETGPLWKQFLRVIDTEMASEEYGAVLAGAERAYHFMLSRLEGSANH